MRLLALLLCLIALPAWAAPAHYSKGATVSGSLIADHLFGDGSGLSGVSGGGGSGDKIVSGTTSVAAISATLNVSVTAGGQNVMNIQSQTVTVSGTISATSLSLKGATVAVPVCTESGQLATTASGIVGFTHGLGVTPTDVSARLINITSNAGYVPGDVYFIKGNVAQAGGQGQAMGLYANSTSATAPFGNAALSIVQKSGTQTTQITTADWNLIIRACK